ncbi:MAG: hypothetical protein WDO70_10195 [Alphaproteobacteria bacterium]
MPFISRDPVTKVIIRATTREVPGTEFVPHSHPELMAFMQARGVDLKQVDEALSELRRTDMDMSRAVEDVITALLRKNILKMGDLPKAVQDRIALRVKMRVQIAEAYDRATSSGRPI